MKMWEYGKSFIGTPYSWGANDIAMSVDCSGFVCELLRMNGIIGKKDYSSRMLFDELRSSFIEPCEDAVLFFGKDFQRITHVAVAIDAEYLIEASGEGRIETDKGFVRIRKINHRRDFLCALKVSL